MRIAALALHESEHWPAVEFGKFAPGLNVVYGPTGSGKSTIADLVAHALYGRRCQASPNTSPDGELVVECGGRHFRLRRYQQQDAAERLTVTSLDEGPVEEDTVRQWLSGLSPSLLGLLFIVNFREPPRLSWILSREFAHEYRAAISRIAWAPPNVKEELRPLYARLRALERKVAILVQALSHDRPETPTVRTRRRTVHHGSRASDFLTQLTGGDLVQLRLGGMTRGPRVVNRDRASRPLGSISSAQRDQVYLSLSLALVTALSRPGVQLPLVFDEPFVRLDRRSTTALAAVLDDFARRGQQVFVFTASKDAVERFAAAGVTIHDLVGLQRRAAEPAVTLAAPRIIRPDQTKRRAKQSASPMRGNRSEKTRRREAG